MRALIRCRGDVGCAFLPDGMDAPGPGAGAIYIFIFSPPRRALRSMAMFTAFLLRGTLVDFRATSSDGGTARIRTVRSPLTLPTVPARRLYRPLDLPAAAGDMDFPARRCATRGLGAIIGPNEASPRRHFQPTPSASSSGRLTDLDAHFSLLFALRSYR